MVLTGANTESYSTKSRHVAETTTTKNKNSMAKKTGTKHHALIKLEDLNKMFKDNDVIPIPKGFVKSIAYLISAHSVSLADMGDDAGNAPVISGKSEANEDSSIQMSVTDFNSEELSSDSVAETNQTVEA